MSGSGQAMQLPQSMGPFEKIDGHAAPAAGTAVAGYPQSCTLKFDIKSQDDTNWCWAAVAASIAAYYAALEHDPPPDEQCQIASLFTGKPCCPPKSNPDGNVDRPLVLPLSKYGYLQGDAAIENSIPFADVQKDLCDGRPVCGRLDTAVGHFIVITGYDLDGGEPHIVVADPSGKLHGAYLLSTFEKTAGAPWNETCRTKKSRDPA